MEFAYNIIRTTKKEDMFEKVKQYIKKEEELIEKESRENPQSWIMIKSDFYSKTLYCPNWGVVLAFLKKNEGYNYKITNIQKSFYDFKDDDYIIISGIFGGYSVHKVRNLR